MGFIQTHSEISEAFTQSVSSIALLIVIRSFVNILLIIRVQCVTLTQMHYLFHGIPQRLRAHVLAGAELIRFMTLDHNNLQVYL